MRIAVVGFGIMGAMATMALARRGVTVVAFEQFATGHPYGASGGGQTRIFRTLDDDPDGRALLARSREIVGELAATGAAPLFRPCGALAVGGRGTQAVPAGAQLSAPGVHVLDAAQARERWPQHALADDDVVVVDERGGLLHVGEVLAAVERACDAAPVTVRAGVRVTGVHSAGTGVHVVTSDGVERVDAAVLACGRWLPRLGIAPPRPTVERRVVLSWLDVDEPVRYGPAVFPPGQRAGPDGGPVFSFFPVTDGRTIKINVQLPQPAVTDTDVLHPAVERDYCASWLAGIRELLPGVGGPPGRVETYVESYTPSRRGFVHRIAPGAPIVALGGFSGTGFRYAPAVGEAVAAMVVEDGTDVVSGPFATVSAGRS